MSEFTVFNSDVFEALKKIPDNSIDCVFTSPPYWALRDYGVKGQIGLEPHPQQFIETMLRLGNEVRRVLAPHGTYWLNLGDTYFGSGVKTPETTHEGTYMLSQVELTEKQSFDRPWLKEKSNWLQPKQKMLIPHRVAIAMQNDGWILRNDLVWRKHNTMPSSVKDRLRNTFE